MTLARHRKTLTRRAMTRGKRKRTQPKQSRKAVRKPAATAPVNPNRTKADPPPELDNRVSREAL